MSTSLYTASLTSDEVSALCAELGVSADFRSACANTYKACLTAHLTAEQFEDPAHHALTCALFVDTLIQRGAKILTWEPRKEHKLYLAIDVPASGILDKEGRYPKRFPWGEAVYLPHSIGVVELEVQFEIYPHTRLRTSYGLRNLAFTETKVAPTYLSYYGSIVGNIYSRPLELDKQVPVTILWTSAVGTGDYFRADAWYLQTYWDIHDFAISNLDEHELTHLSTRQQIVAYLKSGKPLYNRDGAECHYGHSILLTKDRRNYADR